jgi:kinetochore protein Mis12/MTW1
LTRLESLCATIEAQDELPPKFIEMYQEISSLPPLNIQSTVNLTEPGKRQWETNKTGYANWAIRQLLAKGKVGESDGHASVDKLDAVAAEIATGEELQRALHSFDAELGQ